jgi:hypothetical protein
MLRMFCDVRRERGGVDDDERVPASRTRRETRSSGLAPGGSPDTATRRCPRVHFGAAAHSRIRITGGPGLTDRSFTMAADTGRGTSPYPGPRAVRHPAERASLPGDPDQADARDTAL